MKEEKLLLILDIDETLIHATSNKLDKEEDFSVFNYYVYQRPYLHEFIDEIRNDYHLAIWSSASDDYVREIVNCIIPKEINLQFVWGRSRCKPKRILDIDSYGIYDNRYQEQYNYIKPLKKVKKLGFKLERTLIVDDTPHKCIENYGNAIYPKEYLGQNDDDELLFLAKYLKTLKDEKNVRKIEKRDWKKKIQK
ncbi:carboxy-terminal domain RNA polymerase II polypeptide A small phosphatase [Tenacibaculum sp. MAR_2009_124]|uniref:HAD family hydrolase n=1 Tax=Tenacibaculum sp. MAR_2009_124 TaxID=1250059 RepID=UPI00089C8BE5|nr:HAD family hydrolase [Tenacibaculum sp. MAR_2009_124]SEC79268.1 carboxy-terminal domain RNA polymerase II polypeptide A small phosphatase [Tenacibaculum sp. MAR_2009_124]